MARNPLRRRQREALIASSAPVTAKRPGGPQPRPKTEDWQRRGLGAVRDVPELKQVANTYGMVMRKLILEPASVVGPDRMPFPADPTDEGAAGDAERALPPALAVAARDVHDRILPFLADIAYAHTYLTWTVGEWRLVCTDAVLDSTGRVIAPEQWHALPPVQSRGRPETWAYAQRVWIPSAEDPMAADSCLNSGMLTLCEQLVILDRSITAASLSQIQRGKALVWDRAMVPDVLKDDADRQAWAARWDAQITEAFSSSVLDPGAASSVAPINVWLDRKVAEMPEVLDLTDDRVDAQDADKRRSTLLRIAQAASCPPQRILGVQDVNHWSAETVMEDEWSSYLEPLADLLRDALTALLRALLTGPAYGFTDADASLVAYAADASRIVKRKDRGGDAVLAYDRGQLDGAGLREALGIDESHAPDEGERRFLAAWEKGALDAVTSASILAPGAPTAKADTGGTVVVHAPPVTVPVTAAAPIPLPPVLQRQILAFGDGQAGRRLGQRLAAAEQDTRAQILGMCDTALIAAMARHGSRVASAARKEEAARTTCARTPAPLRASALGRTMVLALGVADPQAGDFDQLGDDVLALLDALQLQWFAAVCRYLGLGSNVHPGDRVLAAWQSYRRTAVTRLQEQMGGLASRLLFDPDPQSSGEQRVGRVPAGLAREATSAAWSGDPLVGVTTGPVALAPGRPKPPTAAPSAPAGPMPASPSTGPAAEPEPEPSSAGAALPPGPLGSILSDAGERMTGYVWSYGDLGRRNPFHPHEVLDGLEYEREDDPRLAVDATCEWLSTRKTTPVMFRAPGDHRGCVCSAVPVLNGDAADAYARGGMPDGELIVVDDPRVRAA